ncbi:MAG: sulfite exporter TauE/SafE family protein [Saprospiraceae bacterium]|nr:sulfite exporter TauE/SafE family protein [Saprospiraceae bacterium]
MFWLALNMGLVGSLHCIGMCGPLSILGLSGKTHSSKFGILADTMLYQLGRTLSYSMLGFIFGIIGTSFAIAGMQKVVSIVFGLALVILAVTASNWLNKLEGLSFLRRWNNFILNSLHHYLSKMGGKNIAVVGMLNGLIPCGLVYFALATSMALDKISDSILFMFVFGLGTMPLMAAVTWFGLGFRQKIKFSYQKLLPILAFSTGLILLWRGFEIKVPENLALLLSMQHPEMCH